MQDLLYKSVKPQLSLLLNALKTFSSVSLTNEPCRKIVAKIASPYYVRTLLELMMLVPLS
jgi:hypothetical protein